METSNSEHHFEHEESHNHPRQPSYGMILDYRYLELPLNHPSFGQVMQLTPLISSFVSFNNSLFMVMQILFIPFIHLL